MLKCDVVFEKIKNQIEKSCENVSRRLLGLQREYMLAESILKERDSLNFPLELLF